MSRPALLTSIALTVALAAPFQWFMGAGKRTLIIQVLQTGPHRALRHPFYLAYIVAFAALAVAVRTRLCTGVVAANVLLFVVMALHDERVLARSALAASHADDRRRVGVLLLLPWRARAA